ncbi:retrovirus-related pol polyprotein from transposon TNT 1-94 [Tanacetum coccineum]
MSMQVREKKRKVNEQKERRKRGSVKEEKKKKKNKTATRDIKGSKNEEQPESKEKRNKRTDGIRVTKQEKQSDQKEEMDEERTARATVEKKRLFDTPSLVESNSTGYLDHILTYLDHSEEEDQFLKELRDNTFSGSEHKDANEHIEKVLEIVDLFHIPKVTQDQIMLRAFPVSLTGAASKWLRNQTSGSITTWEVLKTKFLNKYCPPACTAKKMDEINNFQQEPDESLFRAWERFKELLMKCPQHYLTDMQEVILFYNGLDVPTRQILD